LSSCPRVIHVPRPPETIYPNYVFRSSDFLHFLTHLSHFDKMRHQSKKLY
jgi:hypothetical protein